MKKYLLGLFAIVLAIGLSAFTTNVNKAKPGLVTYYALKTGSNTWTWSTSTTGYSCSTDLNISCNGFVGSQPADNTVPSGYTTDGHVFVAN